MHRNAVTPGPRRRSAAVRKMLWLALSLIALVLTLSPSKAVRLAAEDDICTPTYRRRLLANIRHPASLDLVDGDGDLDLFVINLPEKNPTHWQHFRTRFSEEQLAIFNLYRSKLGLPQA